MDHEKTFTAFSAVGLIASGELATMLPQLKAWSDRAPAEAEAPLIFDDATGRQVDFDLRGTLAQVLERVSVPARGPGRPKIGVVAREVSLLPRHWEWLEEQPNGA